MNGANVVDNLSRDAEMEKWKINKLKRGSRLVPDQAFGPSSSVLFTIATS